MTLQSENGVITRIRPSCVQCQRWKKRCDRQKPVCSLCQKCEDLFSSLDIQVVTNCSVGRHQRQCTYSTYTSSNPIASDASDDVFPAVFFLDSALFQRSISQLPDPKYGLEPELLSFVGNVSSDMAFINTYFTWIHPWIPFLSKKLLMERVVSPLGPARPGNTLLVAAMKLLANPPPGAGPRTPAYRCIRKSLLRAEETPGYLDFRVLQAMILVAVYELGHAIFPAAYLMIGHCIRYGIALGVNKSVEDVAEGTRNTLESEEKRRTWWASLLIDR